MDRASGGKITRYSFETVCRAVLEARRAESIASVCPKYDITPRILDLWCSQYRNLSDSQLLNLVCFANKTGGDESRLREDDPSILVSEKMLRR